jgi:L-histidine Nalpha-methyltransferase
MIRNQQRDAYPNQSSCLLIEPAYNVPDLAEDVRNGLLTPPRSLPPKYFYDEAGSELFTRICNTPEYYPTRTEDWLLEKYSLNIIEQARPEQILELGSGNSQKTRRLFDACEQYDLVCSYAPFDVCVPMLESTLLQLQTEYEWLDVMPMAGDYHAGLENLPAFQGRRLYVFLGSTIGNFSPLAARNFLNEIKNNMQPGDCLLLGVDRVKDNAVLDAAYNDCQGLTAEFNLNLLHVLNRELSADFRIDYFSHQAGFNEIHSRVEMRLICSKNHTVILQDLEETITFSTSDEILTEISHKYTFDAIENLLQQCGFSINSHFQPDNQYFSLILARFK